jgi:hypothetical protein
VNPRFGSIAAKSNAPPFEFGNAAVFWLDMDYEFAPSSSSADLLPAPVAAE